MDVKNTMFPFFNNVLKLRLIVTGKAECNWLESFNLYSDAESYFDSVTYLFGSENGETFEIPVGVHTYKFDYIFPASIPYNIDGPHGLIRFKAEAALDIPVENDLKTEKVFMVKRHDDLNMVLSPNYRQPCEVEEIETFCRCVWWDSDFIMTMRVPKTGFELGEKIKIQMKLVNESDRYIWTKFNLVKVEQFNSSSPPNTIMRSSVVASKNFRGVYPYQNIEYSKF